MAIAMEKEREFFRTTPTPGKMYYAVLAQRTIFDKTKKAEWGGFGDTRYYAPESHKRYMGVFMSSWNSGSGDGKTYTEIYVKDGKRIQLDYDYEGRTCLEETEEAPDAENENPSKVPIDKQIAPSIY